MTAPCVVRLNNEILGSADPITRALKSAELACYFARIGAFDAAEKIRVDLRAIYGDGRNIRVSIYIMCLEGLLLYFRDLEPSAFDRVARAQLLSVGARDQELTALCSAWLAHIHFNANRFSAAVEALDLVFRSIERGNLPAACRATLVAGDIFRYVGLREISNMWYGRAQQLAVDYGDQATVGALAYNRAALDVFSLRLASVVGEASAMSIDLVDVEVRSAINYQAIARVKSLDHLLIGARCGLLMLRADYSGAQLELEKVLNSGDIPLEYGYRITLQADLVLVYAILGRYELMDSELTKMTSDSILRQSPDDQLLVSASLSAAKDKRDSPLFDDLMIPDLELLKSKHLDLMVSLKEKMTPLQNIPDILAR
jgi:hypothetical protein